MSNGTARAARQLCEEVSAECPVSLTLYGYRPILGVNSFFVALFGLCLLAQIFIGVRRRTWTFLVVLAIGCFGEAVGYAGRVMMNSNPWSDSGFKIQICCLVLAPSFLAAGIYVTLKHIVLYCGPEYSRLKPRLYPWIFIGCDFTSIVLQAIGGGVAAAADATNTKLLDAGNGLIVGGIAFQVVTMGVCGLLLFDFAIRFQRGKRRKSSSPTDSDNEKSEYERTSDAKSTISFRVFCYAIGIAFVTIFIRCIYRLPEMAGGWGNDLMRRETEFLVLDGMMVGIACTLMTVVHPGFFFEPMRKFKN